MTPRLIDVTVAVNAEVEAFTVDYEALVKIGEQEEPVSAETVQSNGQQTVVATGIAGHDARVAIAAGLVCAQNLSLQRIREIDELGFVEF